MGLVQLCAGGAEDGDDGNMERTVWRGKEEKEKRGGEKKREETKKKEGEERKKEKENAVWGRKIKEKSGGNK